MADVRQRSCEAVVRQQQQQQCVNLGLAAAVTQRGECTSECTGVEKMDRILSCVQEDSFIV